MWNIIAASDPSSPIDAASNYLLQYGVLGVCCVLFLVAAFEDWIWFRGPVRSLQAANARLQEANDRLIEAHTASAHALADAVPAMRSMAVALRESRQESEELRRQIEALTSVVERSAELVGELRLDLARKNA